MAEHPQLTSVEVRLRKTRGPTGLIRLKNRSLGPVAKLFLKAASDVVKGTRPRPIAIGRSDKQGVALVCSLGVMPTTSTPMEWGDGRRRNE